MKKIMRKDKKAMKEVKRLIGKKKQGKREFYWCSKLNICDNCGKESEGVEIGFLDFTDENFINLCGECLINLAGLEVCKRYLEKNERHKKS